MYSMPFYRNKHDAKVLAEPACDRDLGVIASYFISSYY